MLYQTQVEKLNTLYNKAGYKTDLLCPVMEEAYPITQSILLDLLKRAAVEDIPQYQSEIEDICKEVASC